MGGGLMQLVAYGAQDIYLTGNPQITFLKLSTVDTLTSPWSLFNKPSTGTADFGKRVVALFLEMVI